MSITVQIEAKSGDYTDQAGFSSTFRFTALVKPFTRDPVKQESTAAFFARALTLKTEADAQAE